MDSLLRPPIESIERHRRARRYNKAIENRKGVSRTHSCIDEFSESVTLELMSKSRAATQHGLIPLEVIERRIYFIRTHKVMLDSDLAELYGVRTKRLNEQVKRNIDRFPADFMFRLNQEESDRLRSQFATSKHGRGGRRYQPYVFTEHGALPGLLR